MKILFYLHHPAHFHLFKNVINNIKVNHDVYIFVTQKDVLINLLKEQKFKYKTLLLNRSVNNKYSQAIRLLRQDIKLFINAIKIKPDILVGTSAANTHIGLLLRKPSIFFK